MNRDSIHNPLYYIALSALSLYLCNRLGYRDESMKFLDFGGKIFHFLLVLFTRIELFHFERILCQIYIYIIIEVKYPQRDIIKKLEIGMDISSWIERKKVRNSSSQMTNDRFPPKMFFARINSERGCSSLSVHSLVLWYARVTRVNRVGLKSCTMKIHQISTSKQERKREKGRKKEKYWWK